ncbi:MAG: methionine synthase [Acidimicrobiales bacterium]
MSGSGTAYLERSRNGLIIFDGATGTNLQLAGLDASDFGGQSLEGCNEALSLYRPEAIASIHQSFFEAGSDVVETNTFGANEIVLSEYSIEDKTREINLASARIAREAAASMSTADRYRYVAGSMGPGTKSPTLGQVRYRALRDMYQSQAEALLEGGVDLLLIETVYDILQAKAAINGAKRAMVALRTRVPLQVQVTIETTGRMLAGTEISAALTSLEALKPDVIGMNCATGPAEMGEPLRYLSQHCTVPISVQPNAGLPSIKDGHMHYDLTPEQLASYHARFIRELGVSIVGGCCGTTPDHIRAVVAACKTMEPARRKITVEPGAASLYSHVPFRQEVSYLSVGERTNANGSKKFREAMIAGEWDAVTSMAREQITNGAHVIDVCVDYTGRDGELDMEQAISRLATQSTAPIMVDTTEGHVAETALQWLGGKAILNSVNLEDGDGPGTRLDQFLTLAREYGAAVVATCIDSSGQARDAAWKLRAAMDIAAIARDHYGLLLSDILVDPLTMPISTGMEESRRDGLETIEAIRRIKAELPEVSTIIGLSNISFGLNPACRQALNSVFLDECIRAGLDSAIAHAGNILPLSRIDDDIKAVCLDLIYDRRSVGYDPLAKLIQLFEGATSGPGPKEDRSGWPVGERLKRRIIEGDKDGIEAELEEAISDGVSPLDIINNHLLPGMKEVGELFGAGQMQLPFVLQSAETMKLAVSYLEPRLPQTGESGKGKIVLATVKGDVHDIGKNLVDIILSNNGYEVVNLGTKVSISEMVDAYLQHDANAIGMSGLLVKSTLVMRDNLEELNQRTLHHIPVILGGAALTRTYVEADLRKLYQGRVFYGKDAFEGLRVMDALSEMHRSVLAGEGNIDADFGTLVSTRRMPQRKSAQLGSSEDREGGNAESAGVDSGRGESRAKPATEVAAEGVTDGVAEGVAEDTAAANGTVRNVTDSNVQGGAAYRSPEVVADNPVFEPPFIGSRIATGIPLDDFMPYLNKTSLYRNQWGFRPEKGEDDQQFKKRVDAVLREELQKIRAKDILIPQAAWGYFPANSDGNDLIIYEDQARRRELVRFTFPRQQKPPYLCIADFFRSLVSEDMDYAAFQLVTMGSLVSEEAAALFAENRYNDYVRLHGLGVECAEALAELWHRRIREEWGFASEDGPSLAGLFRQQYRGGRYSWGYPACPNLEDNAKAVSLLGGENIGVTMSESDQLHPEQTTVAIVCHHPRAKYFIA